MYDLEENDLVVKYYDQAFGVGSEHEITWYLDRVQRQDGPVLDVACGTGRLALLIAEMGRSITAIDQSKGMLEIFRKKLREKPAPVQHLIRIEQHPMTDFKLDEQFAIVLCCDAFFHNLRVADEIACLNCIYDHLLDGGKLLFNIPNPSCAFIDHAEQSQGKIFRERGRFSLEDGSTLVIEHAQAGNRLEQTITTTNKVSRYDQEGSVIESGKSNWHTRYLYHYEAIHLLYRCGFEVESIVGNYQGAPVGQGGQLIIEAVKRAKKS